MKTMKWRLVSCATSLTLWASASAWAAVVPGMETDDYNNFTATANTSIGWSFTPTQNISVTALGVYDDGNDGLTLSHDVALYAIGSAVPLASVTVPAAGGFTEGNLPDGFFKYVNIGGGPVTLLSGQDYVVARYSASGGEFSFNFAPTGLQFNNISFGDTWFTSNTPANNPFLENPFTAANGVAYDNTNPQGGANFLMIEPVPEPSTIMLLAVGGAWLWRRRSV